MNLAEYQKMYGINRIDFDKVHCSDSEEEYADDKLICPYCGTDIEFESEEIDHILKGEPWQCPECEKWFYVSAEITISTTCTPMENKVLDHRRYIEDIYAHADELERRGFDFPERQYGFVEWEVFQEYAKPLFENMERNKK